jgi:Asp-tRNA(Asn)/Glu-tRNA(Gln) amidotransferase C subunit
MKVIGAAASEILTTRLERCELDPLRLELREQTAVILDSLSHERHSRVRPRSGATPERVKELQDELMAITGLLQQVEQVDECDEGPVEVTAPTALMGQLLRGTALEAVERLRETLRQVTEPRPSRPPDDLRAAACIAHASVQTLCDCYAVEHHVRDA